MRRALLFLMLCGLAVGLAGCGDGGNSASKTAYVNGLAKISKEAGKAHQAVEQGAPQATKIAQVQGLLRQFATAEDRIGDEVSKLKPPQDAQAANAQLARGEHDDADEIRALVPKLAKFKSVEQAFGFLQRLGHTKGGQEGTAALTQLKKLGYTSGS